MDFFEEKIWNLAQASAWVVYREKELVTQFEHPTREAFRSLGMYTSMEPTSRKKINSLNDLSLALSDERLQAWGYRANGDNHLEAIPSLEWPDLDLVPPFAYHAKNRTQQYQPWTDIRVESAAVKRLWRSLHETSGRSIFDWEKIGLIYKEIKKSNPEFSQNDVIDETQIEFQDRYLQDPPARSSFFNHIKDWK